MEEEKPRVHVVAVDSGSSSEAAFRWALRAFPLRVSLCLLLSVKDRAQPRGDDPQDRFIILHGLHELPLIDVTTIRRDMHNTEISGAHREIIAKYERLCKEAKVSLLSFAIELCLTETETRLTFR